MSGRPVAHDVEQDETGEGRFGDAHARAYDGSAFAYTGDGWPSGLPASGCPPRELPSEAQHAS